MIPPRYDGLIAATLTPMTASGEVALDEVGPQIDRLISRGVSGLYVCGSTGEGISLTTAERKAVAEESIRCAAKRVPVLVQVGHNSLKEAAELAAHAASSGASAISATCPSYFKIGSCKVLVESMKVVADGAPNLPFYYYHVPSLTGNRISMVEFLRSGSDAIANLVGLKYTSPELFEFQQCVELDGGRFEVMWGVDEMLLAALAVGGKAAVGSTYNIASPLYRRIIEAFQSGDLTKARELQAKSVAFISVLLNYPFQSALKHVLRWQGVATDPNCRMPQQNLTLAQVTSLHKELAAIGFFEWCN